MNKVYLLLRSNNQSGPFSLEELVQFDLKPSDLIWIEGKSISWSSPAEAGVLQPSMIEANETPGKTPKQVAFAFKQMPQRLKQSNTELNPDDKEIRSKYIYVSLPYNTSQEPAAFKEASPEMMMEQKAEELRRRALAYIPSNQGEHGNTTQTRPVGTFTDMEVYSSKGNTQKSKKKRKLSMEVLAISLAAVLSFPAGYLIAKYTSQTKKIETRELPAKPVLNMQAVEPAADETVTGVPPTAKFPETKNPEAITLGTGLAYGTTADPGKEPANKTNFIPAKKKSSKTVSKLPRVKMPVFETTAADVKSEKPEPQVAGNEKVMAAIKEEGAVVIPAAAEKKKTFGQRLGSIFNKSKRNKTDQKPQTEAPQASSNAGVVKEN